MRSMSFHVSSLEELKNHLENLSDDQIEATFAIVFCSVVHDLTAIGKLFTDHNIQLAGATSAGEICNSEIQETGIVVMLMEMKKEWYQVHFSETQEKTTYQIACEAGVKARECYDNPAMIVFSGGIQVDGDQLVFGIKDGVGREIPLFGGLAGDGQGFNDTFTFTNNKNTSNGLLCLIIDADKVEVKGMAACGWEAVGGVNTITEAEGNLLKKINGEPALDVFMRYFGFFDNAQEEVAQELMVSISGQYPLQIMREDGGSILRAPVRANEEDGSLLLAGGVKEGDRFRFSIAPGFEVIEETIQEFSSFSIENPKADALILFSCVGRHAALGPLIEKEIEGLYNYWKTPMIGFFTFGEIGQTRAGICEFHNETCSLVALREK